MPLRPCANIMIPSIALFASVCTLAGANLIPRQASSRDGSSVSPRPTSTSSQRDLWPDGVQDVSGQLESTFPLTCAPGCLAPANAYFSCYIDPNLNGNTPSNPDTCNAYLCQERNYNQLVACLDCIIANGLERPYGYATNTTIGSDTTLPEVYSLAGVKYNPQGFLGVELANGWLKNVTDSCSAAGLALSGVESTVTATPTTTGPYLTTWTRSATVELTQWTGLTEYGTPTPIILTAGASVPPASGGTATPAPSVATSAPAVSGGSASGASGVAPAASQSGAATPRRKVPKERWTCEWVVAGIVGIVAGLR